MIISLKPNIHAIIDEDTSKFVQDTQIKTILDFAQNYYIISSTNEIIPVILKEYIVVN